MTTGEALKALKMCGEADYEKCKSCAFFNVEDCYMEVARLAADAIETMKNCTNCGHNAVCIRVIERKTNKANDYTPCPYWMLGE